MRGLVSVAVQWQRSRDGDSTKYADELAAARDLKHVSLELGGKSPNIILEDADLDVAIPGAANAIFFNHGQCCCAGSRLYVHERHFDKVVAGVSRHAKSIKIGSGLDPTTQMGPMVSEIQRDRVSGYLEAGKKEGRIVQKKNRYSSGCSPMVVAEHSSEALSALNRVMG